MAVTDMVYYPDPVLRTPCTDVEEFDMDLIELVGSLKDTLQYWGGLGLAAPQIGSTDRVFILNKALLEDANTEEFEAMIFVNPRIIEKGGQEEFQEGCLSMPGVTSKVKRALYVNVRAQNIAGEVFEHEATGYTAAAIQHELDHLDGVMYIDHISNLQRRLVMKKYRKVHKKHIRNRDK